MEMVWERAEPPGRPTPAPLSRESIVAAAIRLADADGLDAVSLRKVAAELDAGPMRLYGYVATKDELLELMVDDVYGRIAVPPPSPDWRGGLRELAHATRSATRDHPWFADLIGGRPHLGPGALAHLEASLAGLDAGGVADLPAAREAFHSWLVGALRREVAESNGSTADWQATAGPYLERMLATGRFPTLAGLVHGPDRDGFEAGLDVVLAGIAAWAGGS